MERNYVVGPAGTGLEQVPDLSAGHAPEEDGDASEKTTLEDLEDSHPSTPDAPDASRRGRKRKATRDDRAALDTVDGTRDTDSTTDDCNGAPALAPRRRRPFEEVLLDLLSKRAKEGKITKRTCWCLVLTVQPPVVVVDVPAA
eukprot:m.1433113 g.1433113  ORF g.1433113 m.1433113 type:complete len:143 (+) comp25079_c0_seq18:1-429(+)